MTGFRLFSSNRQELLATRLAENLRAPLLDPLTPEIVIVQSRGMERWISMRLAEAHSIAANISYPFPVSFSFDLFKRALDDVPDQDPLRQEIMIWKILDVLPGLLSEPEFTPLRRYLDDREPRKPVQLAQRIAFLFDQYLIFRPDMILEWDKGLVDRTLDTHEAWQYKLWREVSREYRHQHRAALKQRWHAWVQGPQDKGSLPERVSLFGISSLPPFYLELFHHLSEHCRVDLYFLNPCREYWAEIVRKSWSPEGPPAVFPEGSNPLLASWGQLGGDFLHNIYQKDLNPREEDLFRKPGERSLLEMIQADILEQRTFNDQTAQRRVGHDDGSLRFHSCHSPLREMEALHDSLLDLLQNDAGLTPRDILVMTPDVERYAPYIRAVFGSRAGGRERLPFSIADRDPNTVNRAAGTFQDILDLCATKLTASQVASVLESPVIRPRFSLEQSDMDMIREWIFISGIRWGIDSEHRRSLGLPAHNDFTWNSGLERLLLGHALRPRGARLFQGILPCDGIEGEAAEIAGQLAAFCDTLFGHIRRMEVPAPVTAWQERFFAVIRDLFASGPEFAQDVASLQSAIAGLAREAHDAGFCGPLPLPALRHLLASRLREQGLGRRFISGGITFCSMLPMRSIPFPVVCLVGLNHDAFPRKAPRGSFDLMSHSPKPGDRSPRLDDRYLFLEALLAARKHLHLSFIGQSIEDNSPIPPSVLVSELQDYVRDVFLVPDTPDIIDHLTLTHRLQAFNHEYFSDDPPLYSYSGENLLGAKQVFAQRAPHPFFPAPLPPVQEEDRVLDLNDLKGFLVHPTRFLLQNRLGIRLGLDQRPISDQEPLQHMDPLARYQLGQDLLERFIRHNDDMSLALARAGQQLPPGSAGQAVYDRLHEEAWSMACRVRDHAPTQRLTDLALALDIGNVTLRGTLEGLTPEGAFFYRFATLKAKDLLQAWVTHLALCCLAPADVAPKTTLFGLKGQVWRLQQVTEPRARLADLVDLVYQGQNTPLEFFAQTSLTYARGRLKGKTASAALAEARRVWSGYRFPGEEQDPYLQLAFRDRDDILGDAFETLALFVYEPLLQHLTESA